MISVIIPAYNAEQTLERALASLISNAEYITEVIIVDDCSDNPDYVEQISARFVEFLHINIIRMSANRGPGYARAEGIRAAHGEWVTFLDADDCLTASSLRYVANELYDPQLVLLHTMTIYYESGDFVKENVEHSDGSCGGNFYRLEYLLKHRLVPMIYPRLSEDEFFNDIVNTYIQAVDNKNHDGRYDYPVYEVHHDFDDGFSYALSNWREYVVDARLQGAIYLADFYDGYDAATEHVKNEFLNIFCFSQCMWQGLMSDTDNIISDRDMKLCLDAFRSARNYYIEHFGGDDSDIVDHYNANKDAFFEGAHGSMGFQYEEFIEIEDFIKLLKGEEIV